MNDFYNPQTVAVQNTLARGPQIQGQFDAIGAGFDLLPAADRNKLLTVAYAVTTGTGVAYLVTPPYPQAGYTAGQGLNLKFHTTNTGAVTLNVMGSSGVYLGVKGIARADGTALEAGDLPIGAILELRYDGAQWRLAATVQRGEWSGTLPSQTGNDGKFLRTDGTSYYLFGGMATQAETDARTSTDVNVSPARLAQGTGLKGADIASASTLTLPAVGDYFNVTGTTGVTAISTRVAGRAVVLRFAAALTVTHDATSMILPGGVNITTKADDVLTFVSEGSGNWRCVTGAQAASQAEADARTSTAKPLTPAVIAGGTGLKGTDIASASTLTLPTIGDYFQVTGTTTIAALSARPAGREVALYFAGALTITHSSALVLPGSANIITQAGDVHTFVSEGSGNWRCKSAQPYVAAPTAPGMVLISSQTVSSPVTQLDITSGLDATYDEYLIDFSFDLSLSGSTITLHARFGSGSFPSSGYKYSYVQTNSGSATATVVNSSSAAQADITGAIYGAIAGRLRIYRPTATFHRAIEFETSHYDQSAGEVYCTRGSCWQANGPVDQIRLFLSSNNFTGGFLKLYGIKK